MKQKSTKLLPLAAIVLLLVVLAGGCRKTESPPAANNHFDAKAAQDWWWGSFRKTAAYKQPNLQSPFTGFLLQSRQAAGLTSYIFKHPQFKLATAYTIGQMQVVEVPLLYPVNVITIPGAEHQTPEQNKQIAGASLQRALFFKTTSGNIVARLATIIPAYDYAAKKGFDISHNSFSKLDKDFSGFIFIRQWDEIPVRMVAIENGRTTKTLTLEKSNPAQRDLILQCGWEMVQKEIHTCIMAADQEYENPPDASDCINWQTSYTYDLEWVCHDESYELGGVDCSILDGSAYADCVCSYFGICDGGGGGKDEEDCAAKQAELNDIMNAGWVPNEIEIEPVSETNDEKTVDIKWKVWQFSDIFTSFNNKRIYSKNTAVLKKNADNTCTTVTTDGYYFKDVIHGPLYSTGTTIGYDVAYSETNFTKIMYPCYVDMKINFTVKTSLACNNSPINKEVPQYAAKGVTVNSLY